MPRKGQKGVNPMSLFEILGALLISPLKVLFEIIFSLACDMTNHPGLAVVVMSLAMNVIVLPLYRRADAIQEAAKNKENEMKDTVRHIKSTFSGDEKMMILQAYYRECNYNPLSVLSGSISLMLQIPFFLAAYQFLSGVSAFQGLSFGPIADLSKPDGLICIGGLTLNALPILMTAINVVSSILYLKGYPLKTKLQLYGMALFFLVFLYNRPAGLVMYWTLNNTFALFKTLYYKLPHSKKILAIFMAIAGAALLVVGITWDRRVEQLMLLGIGAALQLGWALPLLKKLPLPRKELNLKPNTALFIAGGLLLSVLVGMLIPSTYISASVQEYIDITYFYSPVWYVVQTLCVSAGFFLVWFGVFYWLAKPKLRALFSMGIWLLCAVMLVTYMFFGKKMGVISPDLTYTSEFYLSRSEKLLNLAVIAVIAVVGFFLCKKLPKVTTSLVLITAITLTVMSVVNLVTVANVSSATKKQLEQSSEALPSFTLSEEGNNVVVIMLDRGIGPFVPYLMEENPELQKQFDGFTYYSNTLSYGGFTNFCTPSLFGGYEYTPVNMNLRSDQPLKEKQNEALKLLPTLFSDEGYKVTLLDPPYAGYKWIPDLSVFDGIPNTRAFAADGRFNNMESSIRRVTDRQRNFFFFSLMKTTPLVLQASVYDEGNYHALPLPSTGSKDYENISPSFLNAYNMLANLDTMTRFTGEDQDTLLVVRSNLTHEPIVLQEPDYTPAGTVDNSDYYPESGKTITAGDSTVTLTREIQISHYHTNMAALMILGDWFDQLRDAGVYDNTRIIVAADHGRTLGVFDEDYSFTGTQPTMYNIEFYQPMLLVKDFGAKGFTVSDTFMTNADMPLLATEGLIEDPVNPFTGNPLSDATKQDPLQYVIASLEWDVSTNNGNQFLPSQWASVPNDADISDKSNWIFYGGEDSRLPPEAEN